MSVRQFLRSTMFLLLASIMIFSMAMLLRDKETTIEGFYAQPRETIDVVVLGGSHVNAAVIPQMFWLEYGISAYNVYSWNQPMWTTYYYLREALRNQRPSVVVVDLYGMTYGRSYIHPASIDSDNYQNAFTIKASPILYEMMLTSRFVSIETPDLPEYLNIVRYHYRWKELLDGTLKPGRKTENQINRGYGYLPQNGAFSAPRYLDVEDYFLEPYVYCVKYLDKIVALAEKEEIRLVFTMMPYTYSKQEVGIFNWVQRYAAEKGVPFFNYSLADGERVGIDYATDLADLGHLNDLGARKVTTDLAAFIYQNYPFPAAGDHSNYEQLAADGEQFSRVVKVNDDLLLSDPDAYLRSVLSDPDYMVLAAFSNDLPEELRAILADTSQRRATVIAADGWMPAESADRLPTSYLLEDYYFTGVCSDSGLALYLGDDWMCQGKYDLVLITYDVRLMRPVEAAVLPAGADGRMIHTEFLTVTLEKQRDRPFEGE